MADIPEWVQRRLIEILGQIPAFEDEGNRRQLLHGLPEKPVGTIPLNAAPHADITNIVKTVAQWRKLASSEELALVVVIKNAQGFVEGLEWYDELDILAQDLRDLKNSTVDPDRVPFTNRDHEIKAIKYPRGPAYYIVEGPAGYGKTELLKELERQFKNENWYCARMQAQETTTLETLTCELASTLGVDLPDKPDWPWGERLGSALQKQWQNNTNQGVEKKGLVLLIDLDEKPSLTLLRKLLQEFILQIEEYLHVLEYFASQHSGFRVIVAGRYLESRLKGNWGQLPVKSITLEPFNYEVIRDSISKYLLHSNRDEMWQLGAHLLYLTGGHPKCMAEVLKMYKETPMPPDKFLQRNSASVWKDIVKHFTDLTYNEIVELLRQRSILDWLSVLRYLDLDILSNVIKIADIKISDEYELEKRLLSTYVVDRKNDGLSDDITRRLLSIRLRHQGNGEHFVDLVSKAQKMCMHQLCNPHSSYGVFWITETLFQALQKHVNRIHNLDERRKIRAHFMDVEIPQVLRTFNHQRRLPHKALQREMERLVSQMGQDWEFRFTVNYYLRESQYNDDPYRELLEKIKQNSIVS